LDFWFENKPSGNPVQYKGIPKYEVFVERAQPKNTLVNPRQFFAEKRLKLRKFAIIPTFIALTLVKQDKLCNFPEVRKHF
jgi:hypothetical protein